jgi:putative phosphoribosyl transferase
VPVAGKDAIADLQRDADAVICLSNPEEFRGLKEFYRDFPKVDDETMANLLRNPRVELSFSDPEPRPRYG